MHKETSFSSLETNQGNHLRKLMELLNGDPLNAVIALGHNWDRTENNWKGVDTQYESKNSATLSLPSKITALTTYLLLRLGYTQKIIFSGGKTAGDLKDKPSEASAMLGYIENILLENYAEDPNGQLLKTDPSDRDRFEEQKAHIELEQTSRNTIENARETQKMVKEDDKVGVISIGYHMQQRAKRIFSEEGFDQVKIDLNSDDLLTELIEYIDQNLQEISKRSYGFVKDYLKIRFEVIQLLQDYKEFLSKTLFTRAHGPEYHLGASILENGLKAIHLKELMSYITKRTRS